MPFTLLLDGEPSEIEILARRPRLVLRVNGRVYTVEAREAGGPGTGTLRIDGEAVSHARAQIGETQFLRLHGRTFEARVASLAGAGGRAGGGAVTRGETVITIESMKLQMALPAPRDGVIAELLTQEGGGFDKDAVLARLVSIGEE